MTDWQPIETAPKDGTIIHIGWKFPEDLEMQEWFPMQWNETVVNSLFPGVVGMWVSSDMSFTWTEHDPDCAPTHWRTLPN